jgi:hypothetical protein
VSRFPVIRVLSLCLVAVYIALGVLALACPLDLTPSGGGHQHHREPHHGKAGHALLCAWACQAGSSVHLNPSGADEQPLLLFLGVAAALCLLLPIGNRDRVRSRSPPAPSSL